MFNKNIKLVLAALVIITAVWQFTENNIGNGISLLLLSAMFILLYYKNEMILLAFLKLRKQDFDGATKLLNKIKNPELSKLQEYLTEEELLALWPESEVKDIPSKFKNTLRCKKALDFFKYYFEAEIWQARENEIKQEVGN